MIHLTYSNRTEALFERFARDLARDRAGGNLFAPARLVVPNRNVETWLKRQLARRDGIAANFEVLFLQRFVSGLIAAHDPALRLVDSDLMQDLILSVLLDDARLRSEAGLAPVRAYLGGGGDEPEAIDQRRVQLAVQLARLFEEYVFSRPEMIAAWPARATLAGTRWAETEAWQRLLWLQIFGSHEGGLLRRRAKEGGERFKTLPQVLTDLPLDALAGGRPVYLFGVSYVATLFQQVLARIARAGELCVYTLNPCMEFWEDLQTHRELARRDQLPHRGTRLSPDLIETSEDPFELKAPGDTPALALWGRPGRENIRLLDQLSQCDFHDAFEDPLEACPGQATLLAQLQHDILVRQRERQRPEPAGAFAGDRSLTLLACPGVRREAEAIAAEIWALIHEDERRPETPEQPRLRFNDIAVMVAGREPQTYFTHLSAAFEERGFEIPCTLEATALTTQSRTAEAAQLLVELPFGRFTRAEVLRVVTHPAVAARFPEADPEDWARWCDAVGIFHGVDRQDHAGSYLDRDLHSWDQGLRRLALGAVMTGAKSNDPRRFALGAEEYLPEEHTESTQGSAAAFGRLVRSLLSDVRFLKAQKLPMADWAELLGRMLDTYLVPQSDFERGDLDKCLAAVRGLGEMGLDGQPVGYRIAGELAKSVLGALRRSRSRHADEGVSLSTLQPMRALPFRVIFVAGLGEGRFPATDRRSELDLKAARLRAGDVSPREQDQYMFLETLLCARERLYLSYLARNELTGEPLLPSPVLVELLRMLEGGYLEKAERTLTRKVSLRRFDLQPRGEAARDGGEPLPSPPEARAEARMLALRQAIEPAAGGARRLDRSLLRAVLPPEAIAEAESRLKLCRIPEGARAFADKGLLRVRLSDLKRFLQCPLQGAARFLLRLEEDEEGRALLEDEPFEGGRREQMAGQRHVFREWLRQKGSSDFEKLAEDWASPRIAAGLLPAGYLWELEKGSLVSGPQVWQELLEQTEHRFEGLAVHGFGPAGELAQVDRKHDPICLEADGLAMEIVGTTGPLSADGDTELGLYQRSSNGNR
ncbi:MAG: exodeoxyribonuclease V subunit gamma, partial [Deltaproteobacteria bacterium]|nr:exodeoxyribonuclease V subunit gamma [Deltaproteobacteria bacterium]